MSKRFQRFNFVVVAVDVVVVVVVVIVVVVAVVVVVVYAVVVGAKGETNGLQAMLSVSLFGYHFSKRLALRISKIFGMELDNDK